MTTDIVQTERAKKAAQTAAADQVKANHNRQTVWVVLVIALVLVVGILVLLGFTPSTIFIICGIIALTAIGLDWVENHKGREK